MLPRIIAFLLIIWITYLYFTQKIYKKTISKFQHLKSELSNKKNPRNRRLLHFQTSKRKLKTLHLPKQYKIYKYIENKPSEGPHPCQLLLVASLYQLKFQPKKVETKNINNNTQQQQSL
jgi:hypothetical protein